MSQSLDKQKALLMTLEVERLGKEGHLPFLLIVHCPDTGEWVRSSLSMRGKPDAIEAFSAVTESYFNKLANES